jgi:hypothetical protein
MNIQREIRDPREVCGLGWSMLLRFKKETARRTECSGLSEQ